MRAEIQYPGAAPKTPGLVGKLTDTQLRDQMTWAIVPDDEVMLAAVTVRHVVPLNGSTLTIVNPCDPSTVAGTPGGCYLERPGGYGRIVKAG